MFICADCIKDYIIDLPLEVLCISYGNCEDCKEIKPCYDVPHNDYMHKDSLMAKRLKRR